MYTSFAYIYDKLMYDVDYKEWANYIEEIFRKYDISPGSILDLGCGTGNLTVEMAKRNYEMIGVDISTDMLMCAKEKSLIEKVDILYLNQDMSNFELYGTVDAVICLMDSLNYITNKNDLKRLFKLVNNYLNPGGLFIFDINTQYKLEKILGDNVFYDVGEEITYIWDNRYDKRKKQCEFDLTFFIKDGTGYNRCDELHYERAFTNKEIEDLINYSNLKLLNVFDALKFTSPNKKSERIFYISKK
jgi:predicted TPR repeat methyltransferase